eukprot:8568311-Heterocapsa_arctica.AAC.1
MHVLLQRDDASLLLGSPTTDVDPLPAAAGRAWNAGHDMCARMLSNITECRVKRLPASEVKGRSVATHCVLSL